MKSNKYELTIKNQQLHNKLSIREREMVNIWFEHAKKNLRLHYTKYKQLHEIFEEIKDEIMKISYR